MSETFENFFNNLINQSPVHKLKINNALHQIIEKYTFQYTIMLENENKVPNDKI